MNPAPAQTLPPELLQLVTYLVPNESETSRLSGVPVVDSVSQEQAASQLRLKGVGGVILTLGGRVAYVSDGAKTFSVPAIPVTSVDTTAAGDAFVAGLSVSIAAGWPLREAVRTAAATGALATTKAGAQSSLPCADPPQRRPCARTSQR
jgi:ribokinase